MKIQIQTLTTLLSLLLLELYAQPLSFERCSQLHCAEQWAGCTDDLTCLIATKKCLKKCTDDSSIGCWLPCLLEENSAGAGKLYVCAQKSGCVGKVEGTGEGKGTARGSNTGEVQRGNLKRQAVGVGGQGKEESAENIQIHKNRTVDKNNQIVNNNKPADIISPITTPSTVINITSQITPITPTPKVPTPQPTTVPPLKNPPTPNQNPSASPAPATAPTPIPTPNTPEPNKQTNKSITSASTTSSTSAATTTTTNINNTINGNANANTADSTSLDGAAGSSLFSVRTRELIRLKFQDGMENGTKNGNIVNQSLGNLSNNITTTSNNIINNNITNTNNNTISTINTTNITINNIPMNSSNENNKNKSNNMSTQNSTGNVNSNTSNINNNTISTVIGGNVGSRNNSEGRMDLDGRKFQQPSRNITKDTTSNSQKPTTKTQTNPSTTIPVPSTTSTIPTTPIRAPASTPTPPRPPKPELPITEQNIQTTITCITKTCSPHLATCSQSQPCTKTFLTCFALCRNDYGCWDECLGRGAAVGGFGDGSNSTKGSYLGAMAMLGCVKENGCFLWQ